LKIAPFAASMTNRPRHGGSLWWTSFQVLTQQSDPTTARKYWNKLEAAAENVEGSQLVTDCHQV